MKRHQLFGLRKTQFDIVLRRRRRRTYSSDDARCGRENGCRSKQNVTVQGARTDCMFTRRNVTQNILKFRDLENAGQGHGVRSQ